MLSNHCSASPGQTCSQCPDKSWIHAGLYAILAKQSCVAAPQAGCANTAAQEYAQDAGFVWESIRSGAYVILKMLIFLLLLMTHAGTGPTVTSSSNDPLSIIGPSVCSIASGPRECAISKELKSLKAVLLFSCMAQSDLTSMPASGLLQPEGDHQCIRDYSV